MHGHDTASLQPILSARGVTKTYRTGSREVAALRGVDLDVHAGELVMVMGPSGNGKTTLAKRITSCFGQTIYVPHAVVEDGQIIDVDTLRMIACDCSVTRIIFGPDSEVLDVGRKTRVWTAAQRRAIIARDRHCQGPGCRAKPRHCDIHHLDHWANGGTTSVDGGVLLCRPCHTQEHLKDRYHRRRRSRP